MMKTLVIGRSAYADTILADASIAPHHAELVVTDDGRYFLTDCAGDTGTWRQKRQADGSGWTAIRQDFVTPDEPLRLGDHFCTAAELASAGAADQPAESQGDGNGGDGRRGAGTVQRARGRVERNPITGEIVRGRG